MSAKMAGKASTHNPRAKHVICALDIGTTKVAFAIANATTKGLEILGLGQSTNSGARHGVIVNIDATADAIKKAREEAELMSGLRAERVWLSIGGSHIQSFDSGGMVAVKGREVNTDDIERVIETAKAIALPSDRQVLHCLPKDYKLDGQEGIADPKGMTGVRLEASVHIITGNRSVIQNMLRCVEKAGLEVQGMVLTQLASALAVLSDDEKNLGVTVVDVGGGTCDLITYQRGSVVHSACIPVGGLNFTHDVAMGLRTTQVNAEVIKKKHGIALPDMVNAEETLEVESVGGREPRMIARSSLGRVLEARSDETLRLIHKELTEKGYVGRLGSGVVLTGGGADLRGFIEMTDFIFDVPARKGVPIKVGGLTDIVNGPQFATAMGLVFYGYNEIKDEVTDADENHFDFSGWAKKFRSFITGSEL